MSTPSIPLSGYDFAYDGNYLAAYPIDPPRWEYPFRNNGDNITAHFEQDYLQTKATFVPSALKISHPTYNDFYLIDETRPVEFLPGSGLWRFTRTWSRIPAQQIVPGSRFVTKPDLQGTFPQIFGDSLIMQPEAGVGRWIFYTQKPVTSDSGAPSSTLTGGTFTLTFGADTTGGIAYNATAAAVASALNLLSTITAYGGVTVTGGPSTGYVITFSGYATISAGLASLTVVGGTTAAVVVSTQSGKQQSITITPSMTAALFTGSSSFTPAAANPISCGYFYFWIGSVGFLGRPATGGTFTLTVFGQTTGTLNWNDSTSTIAAALNALSEVAARGGVTLTARIGGYDPANFPTTIYDVRFPAATISAGTYTLTVLGQTTAAIAYNASIADIQTAINALGNVTARGGVIVSGAGFASGRIEIVITFANISTITGNPASLVPSGASLFVSPDTNAGNIQTVSFSVSPSTVRTITAAAHGITATDPIIITAADTIAGSSTQYTTLAVGTFAVPDANTITLFSTSGLLLSPRLITYVGKSTGSVYTSGNTLTRIKRVTDFYLVGVSPGITTIDDIPLPTYEGDPASILDAIFSGDTEINYEVGELELYRDGPIVERTRTTINPSAL